MANSSFDIACEVDLQEVNNAIDQTQRELGNRYDFRGVDWSLKFDKSVPSLQITAEDEMKLKAVIDVILTKMLKRDVPVKSLVYGKTEPSGKILKKDITIQEGLSKEQCKKINQHIKKTKIKVQCQIMGDQVRVSSKKRDDLQAVMQDLKAQDFDFDMQFINYR